MTPAELEHLRRRSDRAFAGAQPDSVLNRIRAIVGSEAAMPATEEGALAVDAYRRLKAGEEPTPRQLAALQLLIRMTRPAPLVHHGRADDLPDEHLDTFPNWAVFQNAAQSLRLIGRIDRAGPGPGGRTATVGTGLLLATRLLLTNHHVLLELSRGTDEIEEGQAVVRFDWEDDSFTPVTPVPVVGVAARHATLDAVVLRLKSAPSGIAAPPADFDSTPLEPNADVVVVGYPIDDSERNPIFVRTIFAEKFGVLRAAPGQCTTRFESGFYHDCSTLGGNSGSPVFSMETGKVVGLHAGGRFLWKNEAVASGAIATLIADARE
jgi:trypsin-like peptidase